MQILAGVEEGLGEGWGGRVGEGVLGGNLTFWPLGCLLTKKTANSLNRVTHSGFLKNL
jgi:hypothetical protein